jgi:hypothetical protein
MDPRRPSDAHFTLPADSRTTFHAFAMTTRACSNVDETLAMLHGEEARKARICVSAMLWSGPSWTRGRDLEGSERRRGGGIRSSIRFYTIL